MQKPKYEAIDSIPTADLTPFMVQVKALKAETPHGLLLVQCGHFYEAYGYDAIAMAHTLELVLTSKAADSHGDRIHLAGIPAHALDHYRARLIEAGFIVAVAEQTEAPKQGVLTPRAITQDA
jgi:DNA mismatch repair protein MutS